MSLAGQMRTGAKRLKEFTIEQLAGEVGVQTRKQKKLLQNSIRDFVRRDEMVRIGDGRYRYVAQKPKQTLRQKLWSLIRWGNSPYFSLDELERLSGAKRDSVSDFCKWLVNNGHAKRTKRGHFRRIGTYKPTVPKTGSKKNGQV